MPRPMVFFFSYFFGNNNTSKNTKMVMKKSDRTRLERKEEKGKRDSMLPSDVDASFRSSQTTASETYMPELPFRLVLCFVARQVRSKVVHTREFSWRYGPLQWVRDTREKWNFGDCTVTRAGTRQRSSTPSRTIKYRLGDSCRIPFDTDNHRRWETRDFCCHHRRHGLHRP